MPIKVTMPALSPTMIEGNLAKWLKKEGDMVNAGDVIAEIETDKATMEVEAVDEGKLGKILIPAGTEKVPVNTVIALLLEEGEKKEDLRNGGLADLKKENKVENKQEMSNLQTLKSSNPPVLQSSSPPKPAGRTFASPLAKRLAKQKGVNLVSIRGSGPHGRIIKSDIEGARGGAAVAASSGPSAYQLANDLGMRFKEIPNNQIKKITAKRLLESKQTIPHFYLTIDCTIDNLLEVRRQINEATNKGLKISVNDFVIKAVAMALKDYPAANVSWTENVILQYEKADVSVAVSTPNGLITPIIRAAEDKSLAEISNEMKGLATRARENKLKPQEFQGGTFTISNLGMYGIKEFSAIINPPQSCILAIGAGIQKPVVENGEVKVRTIMSCTLSVDHRSVDGTVGAEYLQVFKRYIENPASMLV